MYFKDEIKNVTKNTESEKNADNSNMTFMVHYCNRH